MRKYVNTTDHSVTVDEEGRQIGGGEFILVEDGDVNDVITAAEDNGTLIAVDVTEYDEHSPKRVLTGKQQDERKPKMEEEDNEDADDEESDQVLAQNSGSDAETGSTAKKVTTTKKKGSN